MKLLRILGVPLLVAVLAGGVMFYRAARPYGTFSGTIYVDLPRGMSTGGIATELAGRRGGQPWDFLDSPSGQWPRGLKAGEYQF